MNIAMFARTMLCSCLVALVSIAKAAPLAGPAASGLLQAVDLRTNGEPSPWGIDAMHPQLRWVLKEVSTGRPETRKQTGYRIRMAASTVALATTGNLVWDSGRIDSPVFWNIPYNGPALEPQTRYFWQVQVFDGSKTAGPWSAPATFTTGLMRPQDWTAHWIAAEPDGPTFHPGRENAGAMRDHTPPLPIFRKQFDVKRSIASATLYVSGLGQYEVHINGKPIAASVLNPSWTYYSKTVPYNTYDVTTKVDHGSNVIGVLLGNGMYNVEGQRGRYTKFVGSFGQPKLILQLHLRDTAGNTWDVVSDRSWLTHVGPIVYSSTYGGEDYDATHEVVGWDRPFPVSSGWRRALEVEGPGGALHAQVSRPIVSARHLNPIHQTHPADGVTVYDIGQNISGWPRITVKGLAGSTITIKSGELLNGGLVTQRSANASDIDPNLFRYTLRGDATAETWAPRFSYYGFRYLQIEAKAPPGQPASRRPAVIHVAGEWIHADLPVVGNFSSSDSLFDRTHKLIDAAILSNSMSVLTDCPQREKLGWLEQTYLNASSILYNYDASQLYEKMAGDMRDSQAPDGMVPGIAPEYVAFVKPDGTSTVFRDSPEWGSAVILSPWELYRFSGNDAPLRSTYPAMRRYVEYLESRSKGHRLDYGLGDWFDIGPGSPGESQLTSKQVTATAIMYADLKVMQQIAELLHLDSDVRRWRDDAAAVQQAFNAALFHPETNLYDRGSQTALSMPLVLGLVPEDHRAAVLENLVRDIRAHQNHVTAGDIGFHYVVRALTDGGRSDVLVDMLSRTDSPSYGYQLARGATTLTEAWDTNPTASQNHFMLGHGEEWFYRGLAGIRFDLSRDPTHMLELRPNVTSKVASVKVTYDSVLGQIESGFRHLAAGVEFDLHVPDGVVAQVSLPATTIESLSVHARPLCTSGDVSHCELLGGRLSFTLAPGTYQIVQSER